MKVADVQALVAATMRWRGRASRKTFYVSIALAYVAGLLAFPLQLVALWAKSTLTPVLAAVVAAPVFAASLGMAIYFLGVFIRRLHDRGRSGWWLVVFFGPHVAAVTLLSSISTADQGTLTTAFYISILLAMPFMFWGMVEIFLLPGQQGPNRFGTGQEEEVGRQRDSSATV